MVGFLRLCQHFAAKKRQHTGMEEEEQVKEKESTDVIYVCSKRVEKDDKTTKASRETTNHEASKPVEESESSGASNTERKERDTDSTEVIVLSSKRKLDKVDQGVQVKAVDAAKDMPDEAKEEEEAFIALSVEMEKVCQDPASDQSNLSDDFLTTIDTAIEEIDTTLVVPGKALELNVDVVDEEEIIDVVTVSPVPDIGQTEHSNVFLRNYFNPPESLEFPFKSDIEIKEGAEVDEPVIEERTKDPVRNYEGNLATLLDDLSLKPGADVCSGSAAGFTAPKIKYHHEPEERGANEENEVSSSSNVRCGQSRLDRNRCRRRQKQRRRRKKNGAIAKLSQDGDSSVKKKCRKCAAKRRLLREERRSRSLSPAAVNCRVRLLDIATDLRFVDALNR